MQHGTTYTIHNRRSSYVETSQLGSIQKSSNLFRPVQPAVSGHEGIVAYSELSPAKQLQPYIYCYWQLKTSEPLKTPFSYRVVADGCIDIAFNMKTPDESVVMGFHNTFNEFELESNFNYVGIRFLPAMFPVAFKTDASELSNCMLALDDVLPMIARFLREHVNPEYPINRLVHFLDQYFITHVAAGRCDIDNRFFNALQFIYAKQGVLSIGSDIDTGLSSRQMRRLFNFYIGDSPKSFSKVVRFQNVLVAKPSIQSLQRNKLFSDGYYDQAHFIKEFKTFYGATPSEAFN